jgi:arylsulfatase
VLVLSDNGASQEGGPFGMINAMGPYNLRPNRSGKDRAASTTSAAPTRIRTSRWGWAMAANTPLRRYKQNTHGGGIRDPLVMAWDKGIAARGELRHGSATPAISCRPCSMWSACKPPGRGQRRAADAARGRELR